MKLRTRQVLAFLTDDLTVELLAHVRSARHPTQDGLAAAVGVSRDTVHERLTELGDLGIVHGTPGEPQGRGRPPKRYQVTDAARLREFERAADALVRRLVGRARDS